MENSKRKKLRDELRAELKDTLKVVESDYLEEKRLFDEKRLRFQVVQEKALREKDKRLNKRNEVLQIIVALASAVIIPFNLISGLFGMNNLDLPAYVRYLICGVFLSERF